MTSAWDDSNDPMLIQRVADVLLGLKGFYQAKPWVAVGGDASVAFLGGVGDGKATLRATSFGFRGNVTLDFRNYQRRELPLIARFNAQYWFDNSAKLTEGIEDDRYETRHLLTAFERFAYGVDRMDHVRLAAGLEAPLKAGKVGLHPMLEWQWDIPVNRQGVNCIVTANPNDDGCLANDKFKAFPMLLTLGLRILSPPKGLAFTVAADVGLTGTRHFVRELAPTAPYNIILGIAYAFDPGRSAAVAEPGMAAAPTGQVRGQILEQGSGAPVADAFVAVAGQEVSSQDESVQCSAAVPSDTTCELVPSSLDGKLRVLAVDREGNPVSQIVITVRGPSEHRLISDAAGAAVVEALEPGAYTAHIDDPVYLIAVADLDVVARRETTMQIRVLRKPSRPSVVVKKKQLALRRQISFATGSDEILPNSEPILFEVADALLRNPGIELVEIQGHTDNSGAHALNMRLSQERAEAVQRWLAKHGVDPTRLMAKGYGPTRPIVPNITQQNRARNRRVQFRIVRRGDVSAAEAR
ncbi:MAG: OmpA family protein [Deltaproteobacteria bacterium]|nr:OmpA family protein [Deltaproteobacteria bacterium]